MGNDKFLKILINGRLKLMGHEAFLKNLIKTWKGVKIKRGKSKQCSETSKDMDKFIEF